MFGFISRRRCAVARVALTSALLSCMLALSATVHAQRAANQVTITYWQGWTDPVSKSGIVRAIAMFEQSHPNIHVREVDINGSTTDQVILTAITGGKPPDAATMFNIRDLGEWAARGAIMNLDPLIKKYRTNLGDYTKAALSESTYKGHLYGLTVEVDVDSLFINIAAFHAAGLTTFPRTMGEVAADAVKLTKKDAAGRITQLGIGPNPNMVLLPIVPSFNGSWYDAKHHLVTPDNPGVLQALRWEKRLFDKIGVQAYENFVKSPPHNPMADHFVDGTEAMSMNGDWLCNLITPYNKKLHWTAVSPPYADGHPEWQNRTWVDGGINIVPTGSTHPTEAFQFIQFMNSPKVQVMLSTKLGSQSPLRSANVVLMRQRNSCMKLMGNLLNHTASTAFPVLPVSNDYMNAVLAAEDAVVRGKDTPEHALAKVKKTIQAALEAAH